jgi:hypothetical protein
LHFAEVDFMLRQATWQGDYQPVTRLSVASKRHRNGTQTAGTFQRLERLEQTFLAAMGDVPNVTRQEVTVRARHRFFLEGPFHGQKAASKLLNDPFLCLSDIDKSSSCLGPTRQQDPIYPVAGVAIHA